MVTIQKTWIIRTLVVVLSVILWLVVCWADDQIPPSEQKAKESYTLGYECGQNLRNQGMEVDLDVFLSAVRDGLSGEKPAFSYDEMRATLLQVRKKAMVFQDRRVRERSVQNLEEGKAFLEGNKTKEGVITLPSGLQYKVYQEGSGQSPKATDMVTVQYRGTLLDGTEFDSSYARGEPTTLPANGIIRGWTEALPLMKTGAKWQLFVPPELAYGDRQFGRIPPNSLLIFEVELISFTDAPKSQPITTKPASKAPVTKSSINTGGGKPAGARDGP